jgi:hypothetical protein
MSQYSQNVVIFLKLKKIQISRISNLRSTGARVVQIHPPLLSSGTRHVDRLFWTFLTVHSMPTQDVD